MSSNVAGKKHGSDSDRPSLLNFSGINFSDASPLLLVAAVAAAQQQHQRQLQIKQQEQQQLNEEEKADRTRTSTPSSVQSLIWQRSPPSLKESNTLISPQPHMHKVRKLKLYSVDEKIDIIDYAKVIGNRAAGREFNVAESSIREWRKNEERLRSQSERSANGAQRVELLYPHVISSLDAKLVEFIDKSADLDWYSIRDKARELWPSIAKNAEADDVDKEINITMGWVTRFMDRNKDRVPRIAPPVIATANAANGHNASISMVRKSSPFTVEGSSQPEKPVSSSAPSGQTSPASSSSPSPALTNPTSRRKCAQPRRATDATLVLTPEKEKAGPEEPLAKRPKKDENEHNGVQDPIQVC
uniref:HTH CENPB-type domain-containing protein n=2 Tax=Bursaphelenchus xylophilus TaxID=6326 RepID=A0A1I7RSH1_BURXY